MTRASHSERSMNEVPWFVESRSLGGAAGAVAVPTYAQETSGTILGALVDQTGGVLPGVKVVITSVDTGQIREVVTNNVGQYSASVPVGNYEISFLLPNFRPFTARGISLHVNDRLQVNGRLIVGAVETLTVTAERLVQPTSAVRHLIHRLAVQELPLLTRTFVQLVTLVPACRATSGRTPVFATRGTWTSPSTGHAGAPSTGCSMAPPTSTAGTTTRW